MGNYGKYHNFFTRNIRNVEKKGKDRSRESKGVVNLKIEWVDNLSLTVK